MRPCDRTAGRRVLRGVALLLGAGALSACSSLGTSLAVDLARGARVLGDALVQHAPGGAEAVVHHGDPVPRRVCIVFNPDLPLQDFLPALQAELREHRVASRVFDSVAPRPDCDAWLRYSAQADWAAPPLTDTPRAYLRQAALHLHRPDGRFMATASYELSPYFGLTRWASTRRKLAPSVKTLLTGFSS
jgi:hypothetical protein